jgi:hypothetical protein
MYVMPFYKAIPVHLNLSALDFSHGILFFSQNKLVSAPAPDDKTVKRCDLIQQHFVA